jgi:hypothetical protein
MGHGFFGSMTHLGFTIVTRWGVSGGGFYNLGVKWVMGHGSLGSLGSMTRSWVHECDPFRESEEGVFLL